MSSTRKRSWSSPLFVTLGALASSVLPRVAFASVGAGGGLPYEDTFNKIVTSLTGPWAWTVAIVCVILFAYNAIQRGGDLGGATMAFLGPAFICTLLLGAKKLMSFFGQGAMLSASSTHASPSVTLGSILAASLIAAGLVMCTLLLCNRYRRLRGADGELEPSPES